MSLQFSVALVAFLAFCSAERGVYDDVWTCQDQCSYKYQECHPYGDNQYRCECATGGQLNENGKCEDINECDQEGICGDSIGMVCLNTIGSYQCACDIAHFTQNGKECTDIDECQNPNQCYDPNSECVNTIGGFSCDCKNGYNLTTVMGDSGTPHVECQDVDECDDARNDCNDSRPYCVNVAGGYDCTCPPNFLVGQYFGIPDVCIPEPTLNLCAAQMYYQHEKLDFDGANQKCEDQDMRLTTCIGTEASGVQASTWCDWFPNPLKSDNKSFVDSDGYTMLEYGVEAIDFLTGAWLGGAVESEDTSPSSYQYVYMSGVSGGLVVTDDKTALRNFLCVKD